MIDLVLTAWLSRIMARTMSTIDNTFRKFTMSQIKLFLFSGHDMTSSTTCYLFYVLATNPDVLAHVRHEHASTLGSNASKITCLITSDPFALNKLPYTYAVIKETLRIYLAVSSTRAGEPGFNITNDLGRYFPTDGFLVWANPLLIHRDPTY